MSVSSNNNVSRRGMYQATALARQPAFIYPTPHQQRQQQQHHETVPAAIRRASGPSINSRVLNSEEVDEFLRRYGNKFFAGFRPHHNDGNQSTATTTPIRYAAPPVRRRTNNVENPNGWGPADLMAPPHASAATPRNEPIIDTPTLPPLTPPLIRRQQSAVHPSGATPSVGSDTTQRNSNKVTSIQIYGHPIEPFHQYCFRLQTTKDDASSHVFLSASNMLLQDSTTAMVSTLQSKNATYCIVISHPRTTGTVDGSAENTIMMTTKQASAKRPTNEVLLETGASFGMQFQRLLLPPVSEISDVASSRFLTSQRREAIRCAVVEQLRAPAEQVTVPVFIIDFAVSDELLSSLYARVLQEHQRQLSFHIMFTSDVASKVFANASTRDILFRLLSHDQVISFTLPTSEQQSTTLALDTNPALLSTAKQKLVYYFPGKEGTMAYHVQSWCSEWIKLVAYSMATIPRSSISESTTTTSHGIKSTSTASVIDRAQIQLPSHVITGYHQQQRHYGTATALDTFYLSNAEEDEIVAST